MDVIMPEAGLVGNYARPKDVRQVLAHITGRLEWNDDKTWRFFLINQRTPLMDMIYLQNPTFTEWLSPKTAAFVDKEFVTRAKAQWAAHPHLRWILEGDWMSTRPDIVEWFRVTYWKANKIKIQKRANEQCDNGDIQRNESLEKTSTASRDVTAEADTALPNLDKQGSHHESGESGRAWRDVVFDDQ